MVQVILDNEGVVLEPPLHDATLIGVNEEGEDLVLRLCLPSKNVYELVLCELYALSINNYTNQNIVFDVTVVPASVVSREIALRLIHEGTKRNPVDAISDWQRQNLLALAICPTLGADLVALCNRVEYRESDK